MKILPMLFIALCLCSCTNLYHTKISHSLPSQTTGTVWVKRLIPYGSTIASEEEAFYKALATIGLTKSNDMNSADWCLFYSSIIKDSEVTGFSAFQVTDTVMSVVPSRLHTQVLRAELLDGPGRPTRWKAEVTAVTRHLQSKDTLAMIKDALYGFPGATTQEREKWR